VFRVKDVVFIHNRVGKHKCYSSLTFNIPNKTRKPERGTWESTNRSDWRAYKTNPLSTAALG